MSNAIWLTFTTLALRLVFTGFRVAVSNKVGAECMGLYQLTFAIYGISVNLACSGINFAVIRLVSRAYALGKHSIKHIMKNALIYSLIFGVLAFFIVFVLADEIALFWLFDGRSMASIKVFAVSLPFMSLSSALTGFFYALDRVKVTLYSRVIEQAFEIIIFFALFKFVPKNNLEYTCALITFSACASEAIGAVFLTTHYAFFSESKKQKENKIFKKICSISLPAAMGTYLKSGLQTIENTLVPVGFRRFGASQKEALSGYGILCSMVMPVIFFPSFVLSAFSMLLIPQFTRAQSLKREKEIQKNTAFTVRLTLYFALFISANFVVFGKPIGEAIYSANRAGDLIEIMAPLVPFMYLDSIADGLLKGLGEYNRVIWYSTVDTVVSIFLVLFAVPKFGLNGYILVVFVSTMLNSSLSTARLLKITGNKLSFFRDIFSVIIAALAGAIISKLFIALLGLEKIIELVMSLVVSVVIFVLLLKLFCKSAYKILLASVNMFVSIFSKRNLQSKKNINNICVST